jgi:hypothetical protein
MPEITRLRRPSANGSRVPTNLLPNAIRWERARARIFSELGDRDRASQATGLVFYYEKRVMDEAVLEEIS